MAPPRHHNGKFAGLLLSVLCLFWNLQVAAQDSAAVPAAPASPASPASSAAPSTLAAPGNDADDAGRNLVVLRGLRIDPAIEDRVLALNPEQISDDDVRAVLAHAPAPRIMLLHGSMPLITMRSFAQFLIDMGYPKDRLVNPHDGAMSYSSYTRGKKIAGTLAWHYEREGMMPLMIGHSQGGVAIVSALLELSGTFSEMVPVYDPIKDEAEERTSIVDPVTGKQRPVVGLEVPYAAALATGKLMRIVLGQWDMINRLHNIPNSVNEFTAFLVPGDIFTASWLTGANQDRYRPMGTAVVRNVILPRSYGHVTLPQTRHLANNAITRAWINTYKPGNPTPEPPSDPDLDTTNILHAADIWFSIKKQWTLAAQEIIRARRALPDART